MAINYPSGVGPESILTANIANEAVTQAKLAANSVSVGKIVNGVVTGAKISENQAPPAKPAGEGQVTQQSNQNGCRKVAARLIGNGVKTEWEYNALIGEALPITGVIKVATGASVLSGWTAKAEGTQIKFTFTAAPAAGEELYLIVVW